MTTPKGQVSIGRRRRQFDIQISSTNTLTFERPPPTHEDDIIFQREYVKLFDKVHQAMIPLVPRNDVMIITRGESSLQMRQEQERLEEEERANIRRQRIMEGQQNEQEEEEVAQRIPSPPNTRVLDGPYLRIELGPIHGEYSFIADLIGNDLVFQSPTSGRMIYYYDNANSKEWIEIDNRHNLIGMFVRDIIRQIHGVPKL
jgi:hypothetical protein